MLSNHGTVATDAMPATLCAIGRAIAATVAYSDIFDHPPSIAEVHRLLIRVPASVTQVRAALGGGYASKWVAVDGEFCYLHGRQTLLARRRACEAAARDLWQAAGRYLRVIEAFPFVRMAAVTGALALSNVEPTDDVDLFVVAAPGRLWLCRGFLVGLARLSRHVGPLLCPNFLVTPRRLEIRDRNLFTAHELFQMVPVSGYDVYRQMLQRNRWAGVYLPNAGPQAAPPDRRWTAAARRTRSALEGVLGGDLGRRLERWEMTRKIEKLRARAGPPGPVVDFDADCCRGHFEDYGRRTLEAFAGRLPALGLAVPPIAAETRRR